MAENDKEGQQSTMDRLERILHWLDNQPSSWVFLGLFLFLVASGGVTLQLGENAFSIGEPSNAVFQAVLLCLGLMALLLGLGIIAIRNYQHNKHLLVALVIVSVVPQYFIISEAIKEPPIHKTIREWVYNPKTNEIETRLSSVALERHKNSQLVLAVRILDPAVDFRNDTRVLFGRVFTAPSKGEPNLRKNINCSALKPSFGDEIEIHLVSIGSNGAINNAKTIGDILRAGGEHIDKSWMSVNPDLENPEHVYQFYLDFTEKNRSLLKAKICN